MLKTLTTFRVALSMLHALAMLFVCYCFLEVYPLLGDEQVLMRWSTQLSPPPKPPFEDFVFVNVQYDKQIIQTGSEAGKEVITDRQLMTYFFRFLNEQQVQHQFILCDIYFTSPVSAESQLRPYDDSLGIELKKAQKMLVAGIPNEEGDGLGKQIYTDIPQGLVSIVSTGNYLYKWQLIQQGTKTMPLLMYEKLENKSLSWLHFNKMPLRFYFKNEDLINKDCSYFGSLADFKDLVQGGAALKEVRKEIYEQAFKGKIIVLGDFSKSDSQFTPVGNMYGSLILTNAFLGLKEGRANIPIWAVLLLWALLSLICYRAMYVELLQAPAWLMPVVRFPLFRFLDYLWLTLILSLISYVLIGTHLSVVFLFLYLKGIRYLKMGGKLQKLEKDLLIANQENEKLLLNIMPKDVAEELKANNGKTKIRRFESATILFADVKGFSKKAEELKKSSPNPAEELIGLLDATFSEMDKISTKYRLERIKTIGDCYMAVGGVPISNDTHPVEVALAALTIQKWMADEKQKRKGDFWEVRLGFHTGELMAGVIGTQRYAYDVWGSDVNIASRMESGGEIGRVHTTESTKNLIEDFFEFEYRGEVEAKNIGLIRAYFLNRIKPELSADEEGFVPNERFWQQKIKGLKFSTD